MLIYKRTVTPESVVYTGTPGKIFILIGIILSIQLLLTGPDKFYYEGKIATLLILTVIFTDFFNMKSKIKNDKKSGKVVDTTGLSILDVY
ncbi:MAG: hypothetical protein ABL917_02055 [Parcubacteria group bacterium]